MQAYVHELFCDSDLFFNFDKNIFTPFPVYFNRNYIVVPFQHKSFKLKSPFNHVAPYKLESTFLLMENDLCKYNPKFPRHKNITSEQYKSMRNLRNSPDIITPADKGSVIVIVDRNDYM